MPFAVTNGPFPNRVALYCAPLVGPFAKPDGTAFNPTTDVSVYVDGSLLPIVSYSFDVVNNRYLLFSSQTFNTQGVIQMVHHMPLPFFEGGVLSPYISGEGTNTAEAWTANTIYQIGDSFIDGNSNLEVVVSVTGAGQTSGTSGATEPSWPGSGTTDDGTLIWAVIPGAGSQVSWNNAQDITGDGLYASPPAYATVTLNQGNVVMTPSTNNITSNFVALNPPFNGPFQTTVTVTGVPILHGDQMLMQLNWRNPFSISISGLTVVVTDSNGNTWSPVGSPQYPAGDFGYFQIFTATSNTQINLGDTLVIVASPTPSGTNLEVNYQGFMNLTGVGVMGSHLQASGTGTALDSGNLSYSGGTAYIVFVAYSDSTLLESPPPPLLQNTLWGTSGGDNSAGFVGSQVGTNFDVTINQSFSGSWATVIFSYALTPIAAVPIMTNRASGTISTNIFTTTITPSGAPIAIGDTGFIFVGAGNDSSPGTAPPNMVSTLTDSAGNTWSRLVPVQVNNWASRPAIGQTEIWTTTFTHAVPNLSTLTITTLMTQNVIAGCCFFCSVNGLVSLGQEIQNNGFAGGSPTTQAFDTGTLTITTPCFLLSVESGFYQTVSTFPFPEGPETNGVYPIATAFQAVYQGTYTDNWVANMTVTGIPWSSNFLAFTLTPQGVGSAFISKYLTASGFAAMVPADATITGMQLIVNGFQDIISPNAVLTASLANPTLTSPPVFTFQLPNNPTAVTVGTPGSNWGLDLTPTFVNNSANLVFNIQAMDINESESPTYSIDGVQVLISYHDNTVGLGGFALLAAFSTSGDSMPPNSSSLTVSPNPSPVATAVNLIYIVTSVSTVKILADGFSTGMLSTTNGGTYTIPGNNSILANPGIVTFQLLCYDADDNPLPEQTQVATLYLT